MSDKKKFLDKDYTRRQFLKLSGKTLAGVTLSSTMLSTLGFAESENPEEEAANSTVWALPQGLLVVNPDKCTGCMRCEINCTLVNDGFVSSYMSRVKMARNLTSSRNGNGLYTENNWVYFPDTCRQCETPPAATPARCRRSMPMKTASARWTPKSAWAAAPAPRRARGICPPSTPKRRNRPSASSAAPAPRAA